MLWILAQCVWIGSLSAQNKKESKVIIEGNVIDSISSEPIPYATISVISMVPELNSKQDTLRQVTDDRGRFRIAVSPAAQYEVSASFIGKNCPSIMHKYPDQKGQRVVLRMTDLDTSLGEVTVTAARQLVRLDADKIAYNVQEDPMSKTENLSELLRRVPLVTVDGTGEVRVKGSTNFKIHLNGKPSNLISKNPKDILRSIPASTIKHIEVITEPGVKYDAEGVTAVLNIVTMGSTLEGYMGTIHLGTSYPFEVTPNAYFTTKIGKFGISGTYLFWESRERNNAKFNVRNEVYGVMTAINDARTEWSNNKGHLGSVDLSYEIDSLNLLSGTLQLNLYDTKQNQSSVGKEYAWGKEHELPTSLIKDMNRTISRSGTVEAGIDYQHSTRLPEELLTLSYRIEHSPSFNKNLLDVDFLKSADVNKPTPEILKSFKQHSQTDARMQEHTGQIDYTRPFGKIHYIETGAKYIYRYAMATPLYEKWNGTKWEPGALFGQNNPISSSPMDYDQHITGLYGAYRIRLGKFSAKTGVRAERGSYDIRYKNVPEANLKHSFFDWVPEASISYNPTPAQQVKLHYGFGVSRPSIQQINPYKFQTSPYVVNYGNPNLENERQHRMALSYNHYSSQMYASLSLSGEVCNNALISYEFIDKDNPKLRHVTYGNVASRQSIGLDIFLNYSPISWMRYYLNGNVSYQKYDATGRKTLNGDRLDIKNQGFHGMSYLSALFMMPKEWRASLTGGVTFTPPTLNQAGTAYYYHSINLTKSFLKKKLDVSLKVNNPFLPYFKIRMNSQGNGYRTFVDIERRIFSAGLSVSYRFGEMKSQIRKAERTIQNDDLMFNKGQKKPSN